MIFFGTGGGVAGTGPLPGVSCANCGTPNAVEAVIYSRYFHLYWIPTFPIGRKGVTVCVFCKQILEPKEMPMSYQAPFQTVQRNTKLPLRHFAGLIILGALMLLSGLAGAL